MQATNPTTKKKKLAPYAPLQFVAPHPPEDCLARLQVQLTPDFIVEAVDVDDATLGFRIRDTHDKIAIRVRGSLRAWAGGEQTRVLCRVDRAAPARRPRLPVPAKEHLYALIGAMLFTAFAWWSLGGWLLLNLTVLFMLLALIASVLVMVASGYVRQIDRMEQHAVKQASLLFDRIVVALGDGPA